MRKIKVNFKEIVGELRHNLREFLLVKMIFDNQIPSCIYNNGQHKVGLPEETKFLESAFGVSKEQITIGREARINYRFYSFLTKRTTPASQNWEKNQGTTHQEAIFVYYMIFIFIMTHADSSNSSIYTHKTAQILFAIWHFALAAACLDPD